MGELEFLFVLLLAAAALVRLADVIGVPYPIVLVLGGLAMGLVPGLPDVILAPEVVFLVFLPPLLATAGFYADPHLLRAERLQIGFLSLALVMVTMVAVAVVARALIDGLPWAGAFVLGAVLAPTDPVAALATFRRIRPPERVSVLVEGEAMLNDAAPLVAFRVALGALTGGAFDLADAVAELIVAAIGGVAVGVAAGWAQTHVVARMRDRPLAIVWTLLGAYGSYVVAEQLHVSGVIAVVVSSLYFGWHAHRAFDADTRLSAIAFWEVLELTLNVLVFILLGLQFPALTEELADTLPLADVVVAGLAIAATVTVVRMASAFTPGVGIGDSWRERVAIGWSGMRGAISLAAALSVPLDAPGRPEIVVMTFVVIGVTLIGQGLTLPPLMAALGLREGPRWSPDEAVARLEAAQAALDRLDELEDDGAPDEALRRLRELYRARFRMCQAVLSGDGGPHGRGDGARLGYTALRRDVIATERAALIALRNQGRVGTDVVRRVERDLDLEEARLPAG